MPAQRACFQCKRLLVTQEENRRGECDKCWRKAVDRSESLRRVGKRNPCGCSGPCRNPSHKPVKPRECRRCMAPLQTTKGNLCERCRADLARDYPEYRKPKPNPDQGEVLAFVAGGIAALFGMHLLCTWGTRWLQSQVVVYQPASFINPDGSVVSG